MVFGTRPAGEGDLIGVPPPRRYLFVSRLNRAMETEVVRSNLESRNISVLEIEKLSHDHSTYNSYKIGVSINKQIMPEALPRVLLLFNTYECSPTIYFYSLYFQNPFRIGY